MADLKVRIETLPSMWVASVRGFGEAPEAAAWAQLRQWAVPRGLLADAERHPVFGFNNPPPRPGRREYGYELWICVDGPEPDEEAVGFKHFEGGTFAVTACKLLGDPGSGPTWRMLWDWAQASEYRWRRSQELERVLDPNAADQDLIVELYLPVEERA